MRQQNQGFLMIGLESCPYSIQLAKKLKQYHPWSSCFWVTRSMTNMENIENIKKKTRHGTFPILYCIPRSKWLLVPSTLEEWFHLPNPSKVLRAKKIGGYDNYCQLFKKC